MPTYAQLAAEAVWRNEFVPPNMETHFLAPLRSHYGMGPALIGAKGDNRHLKGRHRSRNWVAQSIYCTNRTYGNSDVRDKRGDGNWLRGNDIGITGQTLYDACRRLDEAVRAGRLPALAEWFGTFDGRTVVGWFQGKVGSSDESHLYHLHIGWWTESANDEAQMKLAYQIVTGDDDVSFADETIPATSGNGLDHDRTAAVCTSDMWNGETGPDSGFAPGVMTYRQAQLKRIEDIVVGLEAKVDALTVGGVDEDALAAKVADLLAARLKA